MILPEVDLQLAYFKAFHFPFVVDGYIERGYIISQEPIKYYPINIFREKLIMNKVTLTYYIQNYKFTSLLTKFQIWETYLINNTIMKI